MFPSRNNSKYVWCYGQIRKTVVSVYCTVPSRKTRDGLFKWYLTMIYPIDNVLAFFRNRTLKEMYSGQVVSESGKPTMRNEVFTAYNNNVSVGDVRWSLLSHGLCNERLILLQWKSRVHMIPNVSCARRERTFLSYELNIKCLCVKYWTFTTICDTKRYCTWCRKKYAIILTEYSATEREAVPFKSAHDNKLLWTSCKRRFIALCGCGMQLLTLSFRYDLSQLLFQYYITVTV